jgi:predicted ATP-grasp superfamily ATP-dependent carboligase
MDETKCGCLPAKYSKIMSEDKLEFVTEKHPVLIIGFLGPGLVGNIVAGELIEQLSMEQIGYVISEDLPPISIFYDGVLREPFGLYYSREKNIVVARCEVPFNQASSYLDLARLLTDWALKIGIEEISVIQGIGMEEIPVESPVYIAAEKHMIDRLITKGDLNILPRGLIVGPEAAILNEGLNNRLNVYALLVPVNVQIPSPDGAAAVIQKINKIYNLNLNVKKLAEDAQKIKDRLGELNDTTQNQHQQMINMGQPPDSSRGMYL